MQKDKRTAAAAWDRIKSLGVYPGVDSLAEYDKRVHAGIEKARAYLAELRPGQQFDPSPHIVSETHRRVFEAVYPCAGEFRNPGIAQGQTAEAGVEGMGNITHWQNIDPSLQLIRDESSHWLASQSVEAKAEGIAIYRHGFERTSPFPVGTECIGDLLMDELARRELGREISPTLNREIFHDNLVELDQKHNLAPLRDQILDAAGVAEKTRLKEIDRQMASAEAGLKKELDSIKTAEPSSSPNDPDQGHDV